MSFSAQLMKHFWSLVVVGMCLGLLNFSGCSSGGPIGGLTVKLIGLKAAADGTFKMTLRYGNENIGPLAISSSHHKVFFEGALVGEAHSQEAIGLPALNNADQTMTLQATNAAVVNQVLSSGSKANYRLESQLMTSINDNRERIKVNSTGVFDPSAISH